MYIFWNSLNINFQKHPWDNVYTVKHPYLFILHLYSEYFSVLVHIGINQSFSSWALNCMGLNPGLPLTSCVLGQAT